MSAAPGFIGNLYSIQHSYLIKNVGTREKPIIGCDAVIEIPVIASLPQEKTITDDDTFNVVPCIEILGLRGIKFLFETNEGMTVIPIEIGSGEIDPVNNPYTRNRTVLVLPRGTTGIKSCKAISVYGDGVGVQHSLTFGIMPPPYNYDNALFTVTASEVRVIHYDISDLNNRVDDLETKTNNLELTTKTPTFTHIELPKGEGKQTINIENGVLFYHTSFSYPMSAEVTTHNPKITLHGGGRDLTYTLSLTKTTTSVSIDLMTGMIIVYAGVTGEILQQFKLAIPYNGFETLSFENFDDINDTVLRLTLKGARVV